MAKKQKKKSAKIVQPTARVSMPAHILEAITDRASKEGRSLSGMIRWTVEKYLEAL